MKLRVYRTLWGILEETDGEKVILILVLVLVLVFILILTLWGVLEETDGEKVSHQFHHWCWYIGIGIGIYIYINIAIDIDHHQHHEHHHHQAGSPFLAAEDALKEIARLNSDHNTYQPFWSYHISTILIIPHIIPHTSMRSQHISTIKWHWSLWWLCWSYQS